MEGVQKNSLHGMHRDPFSLGFPANVSDLCSPDSDQPKQLALTAANTCDPTGRDNFYREALL